MATKDDLLKEFGRGAREPVCRDGARAQAVYQVNCPHCGAIVQVVSPRPGIVPTALQAYTWGSTFFWSHYASHENQVGCTSPACSKSIVVCWQFHNG